jgi:probable rRNA maturation factor
MARPRIQIEIANRQRTLRPNRRTLTSAVRRVLIYEGITAAEISLAVVNDEEMAELNWRFLRHEGPTDVITFPLSEPNEVPLAAEIVVSADTAKREAQLRGHAAGAELELYVIHAALHLCGYDDHEPADRKRMRARERRYQAPTSPKR